MHIKDFQRKFKNCAFFKIFQGIFQIKHFEIFLVLILLVVRKVAFLTNILVISKPRLQETLQKKITAFYFLLLWRSPFWSRRPSLSKATATFERLCTLLILVIFENISSKNQIVNFSAEDQNFVIVLTFENSTI